MLLIKANTTHTHTHTRTMHLSDGLDLYPVNPLNPIIYLDKYGCGNWLIEYEKIHNGMLWDTVYIVAILAAPN